jgi:hypothetical protein
MTSREEKIKSRSFIFKFRLLSGKLFLKKGVLSIVTEVYMRLRNILIFIIGLILASPLVIKYKMN